MLILFVILRPFDFAPAYAKASAGKQGRLRRMKINNMKETIKKMAHLARLSFPETELARYTEKASAILAYVKQLEELDTSKIEPMSHAMEVKGWLRDDAIVAPKLVEDIIAGAPERDGMYYQVPRVIDES